MADSTIAGAVKPDGFVDYYQLLGVSSTAGAEELKERINDLYNEAQANRNHRVIEKRREYETLLELLPQARTILLDDAKRSRYDAYSEQSKRGIATTDFKAFVNQQMSARTVADPDRVDVLGVAETVTVRSEKATASSARKGPSARARASLMGTAISVIIFFVITLITYFMARDLGLAVLIGALVGVIAWLVSHRPKDKITT